MSLVQCDILLLELAFPDLPEVPKTAVLRPAWAICGGVSIVEDVH